MYLSKAAFDRRRGRRPLRVGLRQSDVQIRRPKAATENPLPGSGQSSVRTPDPNWTVDRRNGPDAYRSVSPEVSLLTPISPRALGRFLSIRLGGDNCLGRRIDSGFLLPS